MFSFRSSAPRVKASPADIRKVCVRVSACPQKAPNLRGGFRKRRLTNTPDATALPMASSNHFTHPCRLEPPL